MSHLNAPATAPLDRLPEWATLIQAPNPGPMTLDGTNTWVLRAPGEQSCVVVDPGPLDEAHLAVVAEHGPVEAIMLTHGHPDHSDGAGRLVELTGAPVVSGSGKLAGLRIDVEPTPGHTADSVCLIVSYPDHSLPAVLSGDTILGRGTTVVAWPDGDLGQYLNSLRQLARVGSVPVLPGHGPALTDCAAAAGYYLRHREARLEEVKAALDAGDTSPEEVVGRVYADVDQALRPAAEWSVRAQLAHLDQIGYVRRESHPLASELDEP